MEDKTTNRYMRIDETGQILVRNPFACWIPELTIRQEIGGTVYTVTGSYEGTQSLLCKLERISTQNLSKKLEGTE